VREERGRLYSLFLRGSRISRVRVFFSGDVTDAAGDESRAKRIASPFSSVFALAAFTLVPTRGSSLLLRDGVAFSFSPVSLS
jgi:hypothetical protein